MDTIKVLLADDHQIILDGLRGLFQKDETIEVIGEALTGPEAIQKVKSALEIDVLVLDLNMPDKDGIEVTLELKASHPEINILILTTYKRPEFIKTLLGNGVDGYLLKNSGKQELINAIKSLAKGKSYFGSEITKIIMESHQKKWGHNYSVVNDLSEREKEVIKLIAFEKTTQEIAEQLYISTHTVNSHRKNILSKLGVKNSVGITKYAIQIGIVKAFDLENGSNL